MARGRSKKHSVATAKNSARLLAAVVVQQADLVAPGLADQAEVFRLGHAIPRPRLFAPGQWRRAVDVAVQAVDVVGELVQDEIPSASVAALRRSALPATPG